MTMVRHPMVNGAAPVAAGPGEGFGPVTPRPVAVPRRRRPLWMVAGLVSAALGALLFVFAGGLLDSSVQVLTVARPVPVGQAIGAGDLAVTRLPADHPGLSPLPVVERGRVLGLRAAVDLRPGTLLTAEQVTDRLVPGPGQQVVGMSLRPGQLPLRSIEPGSRVLVVATPGDGTAASARSGADAGAAVAPLEATVVDLSEPDANGFIVVDLVAASGDGQRIAALASTGRVALVQQTRGTAK